MELYVTGVMELGLESLQALEPTLEVSVESIPDCSILPAISVELGVYNNVVITGDYDGYYNT